MAATTASLPDAPSVLISSSNAGAESYRLQPLEQPAAPVVPPKHLALTIRPGQTAPTLTAADKFKMGFVKMASLGTFGTALVTAAYGQAIDSRPHYGTDSGAFGERLGAAALKQSTKSILYYSVFANVFHEDPRYYVVGPGHPIKRRMLHAALSVLVTPKDNGTGNTANWSLFAATASSSALANAYYPAEDRRLDRTIGSFFTSLVTRAAAQQMREFGGDIRQRLHLKH